MADDTSVEGVGGVRSSTAAVSLEVTFLAMTADFRQNPKLCLDGWLVIHFSTARACVRLSFEVLMCQSIFYILEVLCAVAELLCGAAKV